MSINRQATGMIDPEAGKATQFKPGQSGNPDGRPKGSRSLSTVIRNIAESVDSWEKIPVKNKDAVREMGAPIDAIVMVAYGQAVAGDKSAREWLRKAGWGDKLDLTTLGEKLPTPILGGTSVQTSQGDNQDTESEQPS